MAFALIRNAVNFYLLFVDDSVDAVEVEFMQWRSYWLRHEGDSLPYSTFGVLLSAKEIYTYIYLHIHPWKLFFKYWQLVRLLQQQISVCLVL